MELRKTVTILHKLNLNYTLFNKKIGTLRYCR